VEVEYFNGTKVWITTQMHHWKGKNNYSRKGETETVLLGIFREVIKIFVKIICFSIYVLYSEREKYGINSLKIKHNIFQKNLWTGQF
jgi:hypothetical protein